MLRCVICLFTAFESLIMNDIVSRAQFTAYPIDYHTTYSCSYRTQCIELTHRLLDCPGSWPHSPTVPSPIPLIACRYPICISGRSSNLPTHSTSTITHYWSPIYTDYIQGFWYATHTHRSHHRLIRVRCTLTLNSLISTSNHNIRTILLDACTTKIKATNTLHYTNKSCRSQADVDVGTCVCRTSPVYVVCIEMFVRM